jgi:uncharacterized protein YcbK (DUF882 family)
VARRAGQHFTVAEFDSRDGVKVPAAALQELEYLVAQLLDPLRDRFGPVTVLSGFRSDQHNRSVGGAARSYHKYRLAPGRGVAADVRCARGSVADWIVFLDRRGAGGLGTYDTFVHVDTRHGRTRWKG